MTEPSVVLSPYDTPKGYTLSSLWLAHRGPPDKRLNVATYIKKLREEMTGGAHVIGQ